jgi:hypothetical protein
VPSMAALSAALSAGFPTILMIKQEEGREGVK